MNPENQILIQELSQNVAPEKLGQRMDNLEVVENSSIKKDSVARLGEVSQEIVEKSQLVEDTKQKIDSLRDGLGLPPSSEIPPSIHIQQESIDKLHKEKKDLENKKGSEEALEETKRFERNFKSALENISAQSKTMLDALYERQQGRLTPIQSNERFHRMASGIKNLNSFGGSIDLALITKTAEDIQKLSRLFDDIKLQPVGGQIRENPQNLEKLAFGAKKFSTSCEESKNRIPIEMTDKLMEEQSKELRKSLAQLSEQAQKLWLFANKLRSN